MSLEEAVVEKLRELPPERQLEVLDFVEFLGSRARRSAPAAGVSALDLAGGLVGSVDGGPGDLATDPEHLNGYGEG